MSQWNDLDMDSKIAQVLDVESHAPQHHFGRPFLTPYQIAIRFEELFPAECQAIGKPVGGRGSGRQDSLAQYIAKQLSSRIREGTLRNIEGRFLHRASLRKLEYEEGGQVIEASSMQSYDLSLFRLRD